jgi:hypothetical protein
MFICTYCKDKSTFASKNQMLLVEPPGMNLISFCHKMSLIKIAMVMFTFRSYFDVGIRNYGRDSSL